LDLDKLLVRQVVWMLIIGETRLAGKFLVNPRRLPVRLSTMLNPKNANQFGFLLEDYSPRAHAEPMHGRSVAP